MRCVVYVIFLCGNFSSVYAVPLSSSLLGDGVGSANVLLVLSIAFTWHWTCTMDNVFLFQDSCSPC